MTSPEAVPSKGGRKAEKHTLEQSPHRRLGRRTLPPSNCARSREGLCEDEVQHSRGRREEVDSPAGATIGQKIELNGQEWASRSLRESRLLPLRLPQATSLGRKIIALHWWSPMIFRPALITGIY